MRKYLVYKITNKVNLKLYIGITSEDSVEIRFREGHLRLAESNSESAQKTRRYIHNAIRKYGPENFTIEQIDEAYGLDNALDKEKFYILKYETLNPEKGYNLVLESSNGVEYVSNSTRKKISISNHAALRSDKGGVDRSRGKFIAYIDKERIRYRKCFKTLKDALEGRDMAAIYLYGENAILNYPERKDFYLSQNLKEFFDRFSIKKEKSKKSGVFKIKGGLFSSYAINSKDKKNRINCGTYKTEREAAIARDKVYFYIHGYEDLYIKFLNYSEEILKINKQELEAEATSIIKNGKFIHPYKTEYYGVDFDAQTGKYIAYVHSCFSWKDIICKNIKTKEKAAILHDKIQFMLGRKEEINFPDKLSNYSIDQITKLYKKLTKRKKVISIEYPGVFFDKKKDYYIFTINIKPKISYGGFKTRESAMRAKELYLYFSYGINDLKFLNLKLENLDELKVEYENLESIRKEKIKKQEKKIKYFGVKKTQYETYASVVYVNQKATIKNFKTIEEAARDYDLRHYQVYKNRNKLNFPDLLSV